MSKMNINPKRGWETKWSKEEEDILINNYSLKTIEELIELLPNRNEKGIYSHAHKLKLKYHTYNENYFNEIDTPDKAYWLGFLSADGYITTGYRWGVEIKIDDKPHLEKLNICLESNITIRTRKRKTGAESCSLQFKNKQMYDSFVKWGFTHNKSHEIVFPSIPKNLRLHFIRGVIDGDGSYCKSKNGKYYKYCISLVGANKSFLESIRDALLEELNITASINTHKGLHTLTIGRKKDIKLFCKSVTLQENIMLHRKREKALTFLREMEGKTNVQHEHRDD